MRNRRTIQDQLDSLRPIGGGDGTDDAEHLDAELRDRIGRASELTDEELETLHGEIREAIDEHREGDATDETIAALAELVQALGTVEEVQTSREAAATEREAERQRLLAQADGSGEGEGEGEGETPAEGDGEGEGEGDGEGEGEGETPAETPAEGEGAGEGEGEGEGAPESLAAGATPPTSRPRLRNVGRTPAHGPRRRQTGGEPESPLAIVAAGDIPGRSAGERMEFGELGEAFAEKFEMVTLGGQPVPGRYRVASFRWGDAYPEERTLTAAADARENARRVQDAVQEFEYGSEERSGMEALVASGGLCAPLEPLYDLEMVGHEGRPLRDALPKFGARRGGIRYIEPPRLTDISVRSSGTGETNAIREWTVETDEEPGTAVKGCQRIACGDEVTVIVSARTKCLEIGNFSRMTFPEQFEAWWGLAGVRTARFNEDLTWDAMAAASTAVTAAELLGASRDVLAVIERAATAFRIRHRMRDESPLVAYLPNWVRNVMRVDLTRQQPGDGTISVTDAQIDGWLRDRNVNPVWSPDAGGQWQAFEAQGVGTLTGWPDTAEIILTTPGAFTFLDGGELNFGMEIRSPELNRTNDVQAFTEVFEAVAFRGVESLAITLDLCASGKSSAAAAVDPCTTGS